MKSKKYITAMVKEKAISDMKESISNLKVVATKKGWEEDEVDEKVSEIFENFPWYKYDLQKKSWKSWLWNFCLYSLILYLTVGAILERNRRFKKNLNDFLYDLQIPYQQSRIVRFFSLPILKYYDLSKFHDRDCLINNPFLEKAKVKCEFCDNISTIISTEWNASQINDYIIDGVPFILNDVPGYANTSIQFDDVKGLFMKHGDEMDGAICHISHSKQFSKVSDYFKLSEGEVIAQNLSIVWSNCGTYGTRFYRKLFTRPSFIPNTSEVYLEKSMFFLHPGLEVDAERSVGQSSYFFQVQGITTVSMRVPEECDYDCISQPMMVTLEAGQILVIQNSGWILSLSNGGKGLSIVYKSSFDI